MAEMLFPKRQRCKTCGKKLGDQAHPEVYLGLYDTPGCATMAEPSNDPAKAPRQCVTVRDGKTVFKRRYRSMVEVPDVIADDPSVNVYWCGHCGHLHVGHSRLSGPENLFVVKDRAALAGWLVKLRGKATHVQVVKAAHSRGANKNRVKAIRLKEWEDPSFDSPSLETLFAVLPLYQAGLAGTMKGRA